MQTEVWWTQFCVMSNSGSYACRQVILHTNHLSILQKQLIHKLVWLYVRLYYLRYTLGSCQYLHARHLQVRKTVVFSSVCFPCCYRIFANFWWNKFHEIVKNSPNLQNLWPSKKHPTVIVSKQTYYLAYSHLNQAPVVTYRYIWYNVCVYVDRLLKDILFKHVMYNLPYHLPDKKQIGIGQNFLKYIKDCLLKWTSKCIHLWEGYLIAAFTSELELQGFFKISFNSHRTFVTNSTVLTPIQPKIQLCEFQNMCSLC